jgi:signal peptidase I
MENENLNKEKTKSKKIIKILIEWFIYIFVFVAIVWGTPKALVKIFNTNYPIASITSGSMWPVLKEGDIVFIKGYSGNKADLKVGDIVVFTNEKGFTIHRIIELKDETLITQGDANNVADKPIEYNKLVGVMITYKSQPIRIPYLGKLSQTFKR